MLIYQRAVDDVGINILLLTFPHQLPISWHTNTTSSIYKYLSNSTMSSENLLFQCDEVYQNSHVHVNQLTQLEMILLNSQR